MQHNFLIAPVDTDSISFCKADMAPFSQEERDALLAEINDLSPDFMDWDEDGYYEACLVLKAKNYVLVQNGKYKFRGSSLRDEKKEPALREFMHAMIRDMIEKDSRSVVDIYEQYILEACNISDISRWAVKKTVTKSVLDPERANEQKPLDAINEAIAEGLVEKVQEGDKVWLYTALDGVRQAVVKGVPVVSKKGVPKMIPNRFLRDVRLYNNDADKSHYVKRVYSTLEILGNVLDLSQFTDYTIKKNAKALDELTNRLTFNINNVKVG